MTNKRADGLAPVIAIDGGAGTGKGTARAGVAKALGFLELDSGVLYRATGWECRRKGVSLPADCKMVVEELNIVVEGSRIYLNGVDETANIRSDECGQLASQVGAMKEVREGLLDFQLRMRKHPGLVADGRDQGLIFENSCRFFLTADAEERARRRVKQLEELGLPHVFEDVLRGIRERDKTDRTRSTSPLMPHPKAKVIDTTKLSPDEVVATILREFRVTG